MHRYNIVSRILLSLTVITFALAAPALVQEKRQAYVDVVHVPKDVRTVLRKRAREEELEWLWHEFGMRYHGNVPGDLNAGGIHLQPAPQPYVPPPNPAGVHVPVPEVHVPPLNPEGVHVPEVHVPPQGPADPYRELMELDGDAPPGSPQSGHSHSPPTSPGWSTGSESWHTPPMSPGLSTESDSNHWSTIPNTPNVESRSENRKAADSEMGSNSKVSCRISGTASGVNTNAAQSAVDPGPYPQN